MESIEKAVKKDRDPTPSEVYLHVHTHDHDGESFVDERARAVHVSRNITGKISLSLILINVKHITKPREVKRREEYMVLDLKHKVTTGRIFVSLLALMLHRQFYLQFLNQHQQKIWRSY